MNPFDSSSSSEDEAVPQKVSHGGALRKNKSDITAKQTPTLLTVNSRFAKSYDSKKRREELSSLLHNAGASKGLTGGRYGSDDDDSSSGSSSDSDAELLTDGVSGDILRTINMIRSKDSRIYEEGTVFYDDKGGGNDTTTTTTAKRPTTMTTRFEEERRTRS